MDKEGLLLEKEQAITDLSEKLSHFTKEKKEQEVQTYLDQLSFRETGDSISSLNLDETLQRKRSKVILKSQKYHKPTLKINDQEVLSPQHFKMQKKGKVVESQIPLDIKFSLVYDESVQDLEDESMDIGMQDYNKGNEPPELFSYSRQQDSTEET